MNAEEMVDWMITRIIESVPVKLYGVANALIGGEARAGLIARLAPALERWKMAGEVTKDFESRPKEEDPGYGD